MEIDEAYEEVEDRLRSYRWKIGCPSTFLQGAEFEREVFVRPPKEAGAEGKISKKLLLVCW